MSWSEKVDQHACWPPEFCLKLLSGDELAVNDLNWNVLAILGYVLGILTNKYKRNMLSI